MKVSELYAQVAQLGFEDSLDSDKRFLFATERALYQANSIRPHTSSVNIVHFPPKNLLNISGVNSYDAIMVENGLHTVEVCAPAKAYYFEALGDGLLTIRLCYVDKDTKDETVNIVKDVTFESFNTLKAYKGTIEWEEAPDKVILSFASNNMMCLKSIALYDNLLSTEIIPSYTPFQRYDLSEITGDFLSFASPPIIEANGNTPIYGNYDVDGNSLLLSDSIKGVFKVMYQRKIRLPNRETKPSVNNETIDLDEELCSALPLLVASYVWLEDEPERAAYYKSLYNERISEISQNKRDYKVTKIINTNGW